MAMTPESRKLARLKRQEQGLCNIEGCPNKHEAGKRKCQRHLDMTAKTARDRNYKSVAAGICPRCKIRPPDEDRTYCRECLDECAELTKINYQKDPTKQKEASERWRQDKIANGICTKCGEKPARSDRELCADCAVDRNAYDRERRTEHRRLVLAHYGESCACCGDTTIDLLQIDHINGGGTKHLKEIGLGKLYKWLIDNNFPSGFQALCGSCNHAWGHLRCCPHAKDRLVLVMIDGKEVMQDPKTSKFAKPDYPEPVARKLKRPRYR